MKRGREEEKESGNKGNHQQQCFNWPELLPELQNEVRIKHLNNLDRSMLNMTCKREAARRVRQYNPTIWRCTSEAAFYGHFSLMHWLMREFAVRTKIEWKCFRTNPNKALNPLIISAIKGHQPLELIQTHCMMYGFMPNSLKHMVSLSVEVGHGEIHAWTREMAMGVNISLTLDDFHLHTIRGAIQANREDVVEMAKQAVSVLHDDPGRMYGSMYKLVCQLLSANNVFLSHTILSRHFWIVEQRFLGVVQNTRHTTGIFKYYLDLPFKLHMTIFQELVSGIQRVSGMVPFDGMASELIRANNKDHSEELLWLVREKQVNVTPAMIELLCMRGQHEAFLTWICAHYGTSRVPLDIIRNAVRNKILYPIKVLEILRNTGIPIPADLLVCAITQDSPVHLEYGFSLGLRFEPGTLIPDLGAQCRDWMFDQPSRLKLLNSSIPSGNVDA